MKNTRFHLSAFLIILIAAPGVRGAFWDNAPAKDGWYDVEGIGWVSPRGETGWAYHASLDWIYSEGDDLDSLWVYRPKGWYWTSRELFPYLWRAGMETWVYFNDAHHTFGDPQSGGVFELLYREGWFWERTFYRDLPLHGETFAHAVSEEWDLADLHDGGSGTVSLVYDVADMLAHIHANPKPNGDDWVIGERLNANDLPGVLDYASLRRDEQGEFRMIAEALKRNYQLKVFHNGTALARVEMVYDESMSGPLAGGGSLNLVIDGWPVPFLALWFS